MTAITVDASLFRACAEFQSQEETRYYLNGVYVRKHPDGGTVLVATDGHRMLVAHDKAGICKAAKIIGLEAAAYALLTKAPDLKLEVDDAGIATCGHYRSQKSVVIDATFPDWPLVIKPIVEMAKKRFYGKQVFEVASFNAKLLVTFAKVGKHLNLSTTAMRLVTFSEHSPALVLFPEQPNVFGIIMPMRTNDIDSAVPGFMQPIIEPRVVPAQKSKVKTVKPAARKKVA